jgi:filamentous hemagglutinin
MPGIDNDVVDFYAGSQNGGGLNDPLIMVQADEDDEEEPNPLKPEGWAEQYIIQQHLRFVSQRIAAGHAFKKHIADFPGISTPAQFAAEIDRILRAPTATRVLRGGREAFWDALTGTVVIYNPKDPDLGTAFKPTNGRQYFDRIP